MRQLEELYIPQDERALRRVQKKADELERDVRDWAELVTDFLPPGLTLLHDELYLLRVFLAQQRRLNLELDARDPEPGLRTQLGKVLSFVREAETAERDLNTAAHHIVATKLEHDIDLTCEKFCQNLGIPPISDPAIDWRVSIRYLAQGMHRILSRLNLRRDYATSSKRFELALFARESVNEILTRRIAISAAFAHEPA